MLKVGLTGGIGSGKSTVADFFKELKIDIIDADHLAKTLTHKLEPGYAALLQRYGNTILADDGEINRKVIREIIFGDPNEKRWIEDMMHPLIKKKIIEETAKAHSSYCIVVIPLLIETGSYDLVDRILVIDASIEKQIERTAKRDQVSKNSVVDIIKNQATREERMTVAADIIYNNGDLEQLKQKVHQQHLIYLQMAKTQS